MKTTQEERVLEYMNRFGEITYFKKYILAEDKFLQDNEKHFS